LSEIQGPLPSSKMVELQAVGGLSLMLKVFFEIFEIKENGCPELPEDTRSRTSGYWYNHVSFFCVR